MARWNPSLKEPLQPNGRVGRRLFDEPMLFGAQDQPSWDGLRITHFEEKRDSQFSIDRLGRGNIEPAVIKYLEPRAIADAAKTHNPRRFDGWVHTTVRVLLETAEPALGCEVKPSALDGKEVATDNTVWDDRNLAQNKYHAHIVISDVWKPSLFALVARQKFTKPGVGSVLRSTQLQGETTAGNLGPFVRSSRMLLQKVLRLFPSQRR
jgi:hypothetical protein